MSNEKPQSGDPVDRDTETVADENADRTEQVPFESTEPPAERRGDDAAEVGVAGSGGADARGGDEPVILPPEPSGASAAGPVDAETDAAASGDESSADYDAPAAAAYDAPETSYDAPAAAEYDAPATDHDARGAAYDAPAGYDAPATAAYDAPDSEDDPPAGAAYAAPAAEYGTAATSAYASPVASAEQQQAPPVPYEETASAEQAETTGLEGGVVAAPVVAATPMYVTAPTPPKRRGNRLMGILIDVIATIVFALVFAAVALGLFALRDPNRAVTLWERYLQTAGFWVPVVVFFLAYALLIVIVNRGGWWAHILGSFFVGVIVYFGCIAGALLTVQAWTLTMNQANQFVETLWTSALTIAAAVVARECALWFGAWIAARGRRIRTANLEAQREYDRSIAAGPATSPGA